MDEEFQADDDDLDGSDFDDDTEAPKKASCVVCQSSSFSKNDLGYYICNECGTQSQVPFERSCVLFNVSI